MARQTCIIKGIDNGIFEKVKKTSFESLLKMSKKERADFFTPPNTDEKTAKMVRDLVEEKFQEMSRKVSHKSIKKFYEQIKKSNPKHKDNGAMKYVQNMLDNVSIYSAENLFIQEMVNMDLGIPDLTEVQQQVAELSIKYQDILKQLDNAEKDGLTAKQIAQLQADAGSTYAIVMSLYSDIRDSGKMGNLGKKYRKTTNVLMDGIKNTSSLLMSLRFSLDVGFVLRQGLIYTANHPVKVFKQLPNIFSDFVSWRNPEKAKQQALAKIYSSKYAINGTFQKSGLAIDNIHTIIRESNYFRLTGKLGNIFSPSQIAQENFLQIIRAELMEEYLDSAVASGEILSDEKIKSLATLVNTITGHGRGRIASAGAGFLSSARLLQSQFETITLGLFNKNLKPAEKKKLAQSLLKPLVLVVGLVALGNSDDDYDEVFDPRSSRFLSVKIRNKTIKPFSYFAGIIGLLTKFTLSAYNGLGGDMPELKDSATGLEIFYNDSYGRSLSNDMTNFLINRSSPFLSTIRAVVWGSSFNKQNMSLEERLKFTAWQLTPITAETLYKDGPTKTFIDFIGASTLNDFHSDFLSSISEKEQKILDKKGYDYLRKQNELYDKDVQAYIDSDYFQKLKDKDPESALKNLNKKKTQLKNKYVR